jgi:hypothetical protein
MLKFSKKIVQDNQTVNEDIVEDTDNQVVDAENFKGIYYNENTEQRFYEHGAHFPFRLLCKKLQKIASSQEVKNRISSVEERKNDKTRNINVLDDKRVRNFSLTNNNNKKLNNYTTITNTNIDSKSRNNTNNKYSSLDKESKSKILAFTRINNLPKLNNNFNLTKTTINKSHLNKTVKSDSLLNSSTNKNPNQGSAKRPIDNGPNLKIVSNIKTRNNFSRDKNLVSNPNSFTKSFNNNKENSTLNKLENVKRSLSKSMNDAQLKNKNTTINKNEKVIKVITNMKYVKPFNSKYISSSVAKNNQTSNNSKTSATSSTKNKDRFLSKGSIISKDKINYSIKSRNQSGLPSISKTKNDSIGKTKFVSSTGFGLKSFSNQKNNELIVSNKNKSLINNLTEFNNKKTIAEDKSNQLSTNNKIIIPKKSTISNNQSNIYAKAPKQGIIIEDNCKNNTGKDSVSKFN